VLTLKRDNAVNIVATVNSSTTYNEAGKTLALSDLKTGETLSLHETRASDGTVTVDSVEVVLAHAGGTISAIDGNNITVTARDNSNVKISVSAATTYKDLSKTVSLADLKSGEKIDVAGQRNSDGSINAEVVNVQHDRLGGTVTAINGNSITVTMGGPGRGGPGGQPNGQSNTQSNSSSSSTPVTTTKTIVVNSNTVYDEAGQSAQLSAITVGSHIDALGTLSSDNNSLTALQVNIQLPHVHGQVTAVSGSTITIKDRDGTHQVITNSSTKFLNGTASAALSDVKTGSNLDAAGSLDASGNLTAVTVQLGQPQPGQGGPGGPGGQGGHGGPGER
jgi:hypothetical protein